MYRKITGEKLKKWLIGLSAQAEILVPAKMNGLWTFRLFHNQELPRNFLNSRIPPKNLFFEPLKALLGWKAADGSFQVNSCPAPEAARVIFGLKPCDARALRLLQPVFTGDYPDVFYAGNLSRTLLLGQACRVQCQGSFCSEVGIDRQDSLDFDAFFREIPGGYLVRVITEKGNTLTGEKEFFEESSAGEWNSAKEEIRGKNENPLFNLEKVKAGARERFPDEDFWMRVSAKCINCGICTYLCPTCHCFDLCDLQRPGQGVRLRCFDSCAFPDFTKMAVHNPREEKWRRYRQRVSHKFNFFYENFQTVACVGCGRCVAHCPVNLDLREVLLEMAR